MTQQTAVPPTTPPHATETTRLLCAGTYLDASYRHAVIEELYVHEERVVAPSFGFDAARVLAHALRAQRRELVWAAGIVLLWTVGVTLTHRLALLMLLPVLVMCAAATVRGSGRPHKWYRSPAAWILHGYAWLCLGHAVLTLSGIVARDTQLLDRAHASWDWLTLPQLLLGDSLYDARPYQAWIALALPLVVALAIGSQRRGVARVLAGELSPNRFPDAMADPAERATQGSRFEHVRSLIRREQHAPLVLYRTDRPFCGTGDPHGAWSLGVELRPSEGREHGPVLVESSRGSLTNQAILDHIKHLLHALRLPSAAHGPQLASAVRDRLRQLEVDECVFLPVEGLTSRMQAPYTPDAFETHRRAAVEENGEARRHFLRVQVRGWNDQLVLTVFVRVHVQGGMLMLGVAPYLLRPVRPLFEDADRIAHDRLHAGLLTKAAWALAGVPRATGRSVVTLWETLGQGARLVAGGHGRALADGPARSVRELGSAASISGFQEMDHERYLRAVQSRVAEGVRTALREAGWQTEEFERQIGNVSGGRIVIEPTAHTGAVWAASITSLGVGASQNPTTSPRAPGQERPEG